ncbi:head-tail connector protein [Sphingopyxis indica]|nr:hypothetical protein [Sphingopyxis indica]
MMGAILTPGDVPVSLNEARGWLRMGASIDDAVVAQLIRAATNICEAFIGCRLIAGAVEEVLSVGPGAVQLGVRPVVGVDTAALLSEEGSETALGDGDYRLAIGRDGTGRLTLSGAVGGGRLRVGYRAGIAAGPNEVPEAIRQGIVRLVQHLHEARDGAGGGPPAAVAALWQPWRRMSLGGAA